MNTRLWPRSLFASRPVRKAPTRARPRLEGLEDRTLLNSYFAATAADLIADVGLANAAGGANTITLTAPSSSPYTFTVVNNLTDGSNALPVITGNVTIAGNGDTIERLDNSAAFRLFDVAAGATLTLKDLTLQGGLEYNGGVAAQGGAAYSQGTMTLDGVTVRNNTVVGSTASGGGVYVAQGGLTLTNSTLSGNTARGGGGGDGFGSIPGGPGGGVYVAQGGLTLTNDTFSGNTARGGTGGGGNGGDLLSAQGGAGGNASGGGVSVAQGLVLTDDTFSANVAQGGAAGQCGNGSIPEKWCLLVVLDNIALDFFDPPHIRGDNGDPHSIQDRPRRRLSG